MTNQKVTIKEIAREAGVSTQTVSRVINNRPDVAPATRQRVQTVINRWQYQPSQVARSLTLGKSNNIGVVISGLPQIGPTKLLTGAEAKTRELGYTISLSLIHDTSEKSIDLALNQMLSSRVDGLFWASTPTEDDDSNYLIDRLSQLPFPVVVNGVKPMTPLAFNEIDNRYGGRIATQHLLEKGYKKIGIITGPMNEWSAKERLAGWRVALSQSNSSFDDSLIFYGDWSPASGAKGLYSLCERHPDLDAIFVSNDQMALGVMNSAHALNKRIPEDLGVVGFDNIPESAFFIPPLTTVQQNMSQSAAMAVSELVRLIKAKAEHLPSDPTIQIVKPQLIVRESS
ncbi:MAG: LacI family DNA-binding transcriptional regulator [Chloroflexota bacterium]